MSDVRDGFLKACGHLEGVPSFQALYSQVIAWLEEQLSPGRFAHSVRVGQTARVLALRFGVDPDRCELAGLLHDCARELPVARLCVEAGMLGMELTYLEHMAPMACLHGPVGASLAGEQFGLQADEALLQAIARHTVGAEAMTPLEQVVFLADAIEPGRGDAPYLQDLRLAAETDLAYACRLAYDHTFEYLLRTGQPIHPEAARGRNWFLYQEQVRRVPLTPATSE
jgi:predicted HD superfamily hydrolase involved in NAD metabolism